MKEEQGVEDNIAQVMRSVVVEGDKDRRVVKCMKMCRQDSACGGMYEQVFDPISLIHVWFLGRMAGVIL